jgi:hypothetical protein
MKKSELQQIIKEEISKVLSEGTPEQEKIKKIADQYINLRKAIDNSNYPDDAHTYSAMKKVENVLKQMARKENFRISLTKIIPTQYQDFLNKLNEEDPLQTAFNKKVGMSEPSGAQNTMRSKEYIEGKRSYRTDPKLRNPYVRDPNDGESRGELSKKAEQWTLGYATARNQNPPPDIQSTQPDLSSYYAEKGSGGFTGD